MKDVNSIIDNYDFKSLNVDQLEEYAELIFQRNEHFEIVLPKIVQMCQKTERIYPEFKGIVEKIIEEKVITTDQTSRCGSLLLEFFNADFISVTKVYEILDWFTSKEDYESLVFYFNYISKTLRVKSMAFYLIFLNSFYELRNTNETSIKQEFDKILEEFYEGLTIVDKHSNDVYPSFKMMINMLTHKQDNEVVKECYFSISNTNQI